MKKQHAFSIAVVLSFAALPALAQTTAQTIPPGGASVAAAERAAAVYFTQDSVGDVQLGQLGLEKGQNAAVRALAKAMSDDHTRTANDGLAVAKKLGADVHFKPGDDNVIEYAHLARYSGAQFDKEFAAAMVDAHKNDIKTGQTALEFATDPALRKYLTDGLAINKKHLQMAETAQAQVAKGS
ncbi:MAG TPA: DUF4142 domain-containing protein [Candidatus Elarobacter sp.]